MLNVIIVGRSQILPPRSVRRACIRSSLKPQQLDLIALIVLLALSGDIESNPSPVKFPCSMCDKLVRRNQHAIPCSECDRWTQAKCCVVSLAEYQTLSRRLDNLWLCPGCTIAELPFLTLMRASSFHLVFHHHHTSYPRLPP